MSSWVKTLVVALAVPLVGLVIVIAASEGMEREWRQALEAEFGPIPADLQSAMRLSSLCPDPEFPQDACGEVRLGGIGRIAGIVGVVLSVVLVGFIGLTNLATKRDRRSLVRVFRPGLYIVLLTLAALVILDGVVVIAAAWLGEGMLLGYVHPAIILAVGVAVLIAAYGVLRAVVVMGRQHPLEVEAVVLDREQNRGLFELVEEAARRIGTRAPMHIVAGLEPNFFVTESPVKAGPDNLQGRTLYVSAAASRVLDEPELRAVIGHELGHFKGEDTAFSRQFYPIYRGATESLGVLQASASGLATIALVPPLVILGRFFESFAVAERQISRDRELAADVVGADLTSPAIAASALVKLHATVPDWADTVTATAAAVRDGTSVGNVVARFADRAARGTALSQPGELLEQETPHPVDSHPQLSVRLEALGTPLDSVVSTASILAPVTPASTLFGDAAGLETELSDAFMAHISRLIGGLPTTQLEAADHTASLAAAAAADPVIDRAVAFFTQPRGPELVRPFAPTSGWVSLVDLEYDVHPDPRPFTPLVREGAIPSGDQQLVIRVADSETPDDKRIPAGTAFRPVGLNDRASRQAGLGEDAYEARSEFVVVRGVGEWPVEQQLAGLFVVPSGDPLAADSGPQFRELQALRDAFRSRVRGRDVTAPFDQPLADTQPAS